jgi:serine protease Do
MNMGKKGLAVLLLAGLFFCMTATLFADIKEYVMVVTPMYHEKTRALFADLAKRYDKMGPDYAYWKNYFQILAEEHAFGTGWVYVDPADGENYIITNQHVVAQSQKVNVYFETPDGKRQDYADCPILYVDTTMDLAICQFPDNEKLFETGFKFYEGTPKDMTQVVAAGYPGLGVTPVWQVSMGNISNSQARINPAYTYLIQHSAPIDPGNSGGPLLVQDPSDGMGYKVIGVNTWQAVGRQTTNFSIPVKDVKTVLEKAKRAKAMRGDADAMRAELTRNCKILASELSSEHPDDTKVYQYISYAFVGEKGFEAFDKLTTLYPDVKQAFVDSFFSTDTGSAGPVYTMRLSLYYMFWKSLQARAKSAGLSDLSTLEFKEINFSDSNEIASKTAVRTLFTLGMEGKKENHEISWTIEYGQWRVSNFELPGITIVVTKGGNDKGTGKKTAFVAYLLDIGLGFGTGQFYVKAGNGATFLILDSVTLAGALIGSALTTYSGDAMQLLGAACLVGYAGVRVWEIIDIFGKVSAAKEKGIVAMSPYLEVQPAGVSMGVSFALPAVRPRF